LCFIAFAVALSAAQPIGGPKGYRPRLHEATLTGDACPAGTYELYAYKDLFKVTFHNFSAGVENYVTDNDADLDKDDGETPRVMRVIKTPSIAGKHGSKADESTKAHGLGDLPSTATASCNLVLSVKVHHSTCKAWLALQTTGTSSVAVASGATGSETTSVSVAGGSDPQVDCAYTFLDNEGAFAAPCNTCWVTTHEQRLANNNRLIFNVAITSNLDAGTSNNTASTAEVDVLAGTILTSSDDCGVCIAEAQPLSAPLGLFVDHVADSIKLLESAAPKKLPPLIKVISRKKNANPKF